MKREKQLALCMVAIVFLVGFIDFFSVGQLFAPCLAAQTPVAIWTKSCASSATGMLSPSELIQTSDGGFAIIAYNQFGYYAGCELFKLDSEGNVEWNKTFTEKYNFTPAALVQSNDGGYALVGTSSYWPEDNRTRLVWLLKTDSNGNTQWTKFYGEQSRVSTARSVVQNSDGDYAIAGYCVNPDSGAEGLLLKIDSSGNLLWRKTYGERTDASFYAIVQTSDDGYALAGNARLSGNLEHFWLVKTDSTGIMEWNQTYQRASESIGDLAYSLVNTKDGGYSIAGYTNSGIEEGLIAGSGYAIRYSDAGNYWLVKADKAGNMQWASVFGSYSSGANCIIETSDGGYAFTGSDSAYALAKVDAHGNLQWRYADFNGSASGVTQTKDGAYIITGGGFNLRVSKIRLDGTESVPTGETTLSPSEGTTPHALPTATPITSTSTPNPAEQQLTISLNFVEVAILTVLIVIALLLAVIAVSISKKR